MKTYWDSEGTARSILNSGARWKRMVSFKPRPFYPLVKEPPVHIRYDVGWAPESVWTRCRRQQKAYTKYLKV